jgi:hypothetical protein
MFKSFKLVILLVLTSGNVLSAATYYVSKTGSDSNNGSSSSPFLTISKSISAATSAGDVVNIGAGTYSETVTLNTSGSAGNPITFIGSGVVIGGNLYINANYVTVSGITDSPPSAGMYNAISVNGQNDILTNCTVVNYGATASDQATAIGIGGAYNLVVNCVIRDLNDIDAFHVFGHDQTVLGCTVTNVLQVNYALNHTDFVQSWNTGAGAYNILFKNCTCVDSTCQAGNTETDGSATLHDWTFENCVWENVAQPFFCGITRTKFYNCVFYKSCDNSGSSTPIIFYGIANYDSTGSGAVNCVFLQCGPTPSSTSQGGIGSDGATLTSLLIDHNYFAGTSYAAKVSSSGNYLGTNPVNGGDPKFVNETGYNFHLLTNSVLIGKGINLFVAPINLLGIVTNLVSAFTTDRDGNLLPSSGAWDVGAYEYTANNGNLTPPPTPSGLKILLSP